MLRGRDRAALPDLAGPFLLINVGCFLRVTLQALTDVHPRFFAIVGVSGVLELIALAWWGGHLARLTFGDVNEREGKISRGGSLAEMR
jgi:hypothetical protein